MIAPKRHIAGFSQYRPPSVRRVGRIARLGHNERTIPLPEQVVRSMLAQISAEELSAIPELHSCYEKVGGYLGVDQDAMLLCHGADSAICFTFQCYVEAGDEVVMIDPTYHRYRELCSLYGAMAVPVGYDSALRFRYDEMLSRIGPATKLVVVVNPNSTISSTLDLVQIAALARRAAEHDALVLVDEVYHHFCDITALPLLPDFANVIVLRSFSKAFGLAGVRAGVAVASAEVIRQLRKVAPRHDLNVISARIVEYLLEHDEIMTSYVASVRESAARLAPALRALGFGVETGDSPAALIRLPDGVDRPAFAARLWDAGYEVAAGLPAPLDRHLRLTVGPWTQMEGFVAAAAGLPVMAAPASNAR